MSTHHRGHGRHRHRKHISEMSPDEAALEIQRVYRGHLSREKSKEHKHHRHHRDDNLPGAVNDDNEDDERHHKKRRHSHSRSRRRSISKHDQARSPSAKHRSPRHSTSEKKHSGLHMATTDATNVDDNDDNDGRPEYSVSEGHAFPHFLHPDNAKRSTTLGISLDKAIRHRHITCPHKRHKDGNYSEYNVYEFPVDSFQNYGLGVFLYFKTLQRLSILFIVLTLCAIPAMNYAATTSTDTLDVSYGFETTFLGNIAGNETYIDTYSKDYLETGNTTRLYFYQSTVGDSKVAKEEAGLVIMVMDVIQCIIIFLVVAYLLNHLNSEDKTYRAKVLTADSYTVEVRGLPERELNRMRVAQYFERFGPVADVAMAFNDYAILEKYKERGKIKLEAMAAKRRKDQDTRMALLEKVKQIDVKIKALEHDTKIKLLSAYVTFESQESAKKAIRAYPAGRFWRLCMPDNLKYQGKELFVEMAPAPSNIIYENLEVTSEERHKRRCVTLSVAAIMIFLSMVVSFLSQLFRKSMNSDSSTADCEEDVEYTKNNVDAGIQTISCYCESLGSGIYVEREFCVDYMEEYATAKALLFMASVSVVAVNAGLQRLMKWVTVYERHHSVSHQQAATVIKLFTSYFINTALLALVVNANLSGLLDDLNLGIAFNGQFDNFTVDWYNVVGVSMCITMLLNMFSSTIPSLFWIYYTRYKRDHVNITDMKSQNQLNQLYTGIELNLAARYAAMLNTLFCVLFYSAGLPILLPIGAVTFALQYWCDKMAFFRAHKTPPRFDASLERIFLDLVPWAVFMHMLVAVWFYTSPVMLSETLDNKIVDSSLQYTDVIDISSRIIQWNAFPLFMMSFVFIAYKIVKGAVFQVFCGSVVKSCRTGSEPVLDAYAGQHKQPTYWVARGKVALESYHLSHQLTHHLAFIKTKSMRQLPITEELTEAPAGWLDNKTLHEDVPKNLFEHKDNGQHHHLEDHRLEHTVSIHPDEKFNYGKAHHHAPPLPTADGHHIVPVRCDQCDHNFHVVDQGYAQQYACPHCGWAVMI